MQNYAYIVGLVVGALAMLSVFYVWTKKQVFGSGGSLLSLFGVILIGMSVWSSVKISKSGTDINIELVKELKKNIETMADANVQLTNEVNKLNDQVEVSKRQYLHLTQTLKNKSLINQNQLNQLQNPIKEAPTVDKNMLKNAEFSFKKLTIPH